MTWGNNTGPKGAGQKRQLFSRRRFATAGQTAQQADDEALRAAIACRNQLVRQGAIKEKKPLRSSGVRGVKWVKKEKCWQVQITKTTAGKTEVLEDFKFKVLGDTPEEVEKARLLAVEKRRQLEQTHFHFQVIPETRPTQPQVRPKSGIPGVYWDRTGANWKIQCKDGSGKRQQTSITPKDDSSEEVERARLAAANQLHKMKEQVRQAHVHKMKGQKRKAGPVAG